MVRSSSMAATLAWSASPARLRQRVSRRTKGGTIHALGENVGIFGNAVLDASGYAGGGEIRIGGGWQGGEGLSEAQNTFLGRDATLRADTLRNGDGGSIVMWAQGSTRAHGMISKAAPRVVMAAGLRRRVSMVSRSRVLRTSPRQRAREGCGFCDSHNLDGRGYRGQQQLRRGPCGTFTQTLMERISLTTSSRRR